MELDNLQFLRLLQLADSALPIGTAAHSFGLETLTVEEHLETAQLEAFLGEDMRETGGLEATFCRLAHRYCSILKTDREDRENPLLPLASSDTNNANREMLEVSNDFAVGASWSELNAQVDAYKTARESRNASITLGRRLLQLALSLTEQTTPAIILQQAKEQRGACHYCAAFGLIGAVLGIDEDTTVLAYLHQSLAGLISACQRLLPLGQSQASAMLWHLKSTLLEVAVASEVLALHPENIAVCTPLLDLGSMRHPHLMTRLFIS